MEIVRQISTPVLEFGDKLGIAIYPLMILAAVALFFFAKYSYKLIDIIFPVSCLVVGYFTGAKILASLVILIIPGAESFILSLVLGILCTALALYLLVKESGFATVLLGLGTGYLLFGNVAVFVLRNMKFIREILLNTTMDKAVMLATVLSIICAIGTMIAFALCFDFVYTVLTSVVSVTAAVVIPAIVIFKGMDSPEGIILALAALGAIGGLVLAIAQMRESIDEMKLNDRIIVFGEWN